MLTMKEFRQLVNAELNKQCGLTLSDLRDFDLYNYYDPDFNLEEANDSAIEAAHDLLQDEGFPAEALK